MNFKSSGPKPLLFEDSPVRSPLGASVPKPLSFDDQPKPAASTSGPKALEFGDDVPAPVKTTPVPSTPKSAPKALDFGNEPIPPAPVKRNPGAPVFDNSLTPEERHAVDFARRNFDSLFSRHEVSITNGIRQLLPFKLDTVNNWGKSAMETQASIVNKMAQITREAHGVTAPTAKVLQDMIELPQKLGGLFGRFANKDKLIVQSKLQAVSSQQQLSALLNRAEALQNDMKEQGDRIPTLMVALASAASLADHSDSAISVCVDNRRTMLQQATTQLTIAQSQLQTLREQLVDYHNKIEQVLMVTIPTLEMQLANSR